MRQFQTAVLPGDGIGHEVIPPCLALLDAAALRVRRLLTPIHDLQRRRGLVPTVRRRVAGGGHPGAEAADAVLLGAMGLPDVRYPNGTEIAPQVDIRERFHLYAGVRPLRVLPGAPTPLGDPRATQIDCGSAGTPEIVEAVLSELTCPSATG